MTDLDKFKALFNECRIWRGGGETIPGPDGCTDYKFDIAVACANGKTEYVELIAHFYPNGEWHSTTKQSRAKKRK